MTLFLHEIKMNYKNFLVWFISVAVLCSGCILLFPSVKDSMAAMAESFANMGSFSTAFGMDTISIATMEGFFSAEIGTMYALGAAMFSALLGISMLSKEEAEHTSEFLNTLPLGRMKIITSKLMAIIFLITLFDVINLILFLLSFAFVGESVELRLIISYMLVQYVMHLQIAGICFAISSIYRQNQFGIGLGLALVLYMLDIMSRISDSMKFLKYITPFYYSNATDVIGNAGNIDGILVGIGCAVTVGCVALAYVIYGKKDLTA